MHDDIARRKGGDGITAPNGSARVEPGPTPVPRGDPPAHLMCREPGPPIGMEFRRAVATTECWMVTCPSCLVGWVPVLPDGSRFGYRLAPEIGCSGDFFEPGWPDNGCSPNAIAWWAAWRAAELPPLPEPDDRQRRYARGAALKGKNPLSAARDAGRFAAAAGYDPAVLGAAFAAAIGERVEPHKLTNAIMTGAATPARPPL